LTITKQAFKRKQEHLYCSGKLKSKTNCLIISKNKTLKISAKKTQHMLSFF